MIRTLLLAALAAVAVLAQAQAPQGAPVPGPLRGPVRYRTERQDAVVVKAPAPGPPEYT